jgi:hypothetical protein
MAVCFIGSSNFYSPLGCHFGFREDDKMKIEDVQDLPYMDSWIPLYVNALRGSASCK